MKSYISVLLSLVLLCAASHAQTSTTDELAESKKMLRSDKTVIDCIGSREIQFFIGNGHDDLDVIEACKVADDELLGAIDYIAYISQTYHRDSPWMAANCTTTGSGHSFKCTYRGAWEVFY